MAKPNFYEILNAQPNATFEQLKSNYKQLILQCHPDKLQQQHETAQRKAFEDAQVQNLTNKMTKSKAEAISIRSAAADNVNSGKTTATRSEMEANDDPNRANADTAGGSDGNNCAMNAANNARNRDKSAQIDDRKFVLINEAWNMLKDPAKRKLYDAELLLTKFQAHSNTYASLKLHDLKKCWLQLDDTDDDDGDADDNDVENNLGQTEVAETQNERELANLASKQQQLVYTYDCRCGGQYVVDDSTYNEILQAHQNEGGDGNNSHQNHKQNFDDDDCNENEVLIECSECSLVIKLKR